MKKYTDLIEEATVQDGYVVVLLGGSIGEKRVHAVRFLKGDKVPSKYEILGDKETAKIDAKRMHKLLSPGEKKHYGLKYATAEVKGGKFTGKS